MSYVYYVCGSVSICRDARSLYKNITSMGAGRRKPSVTAEKLLDIAIKYPDTLRELEA
jgi:hypothetical protein